MKTKITEDLTEYRASQTEQTRIADLIALMPTSLLKGLDIGARDGYVSKLMTEHCQQVTALDLSLPEITHEQITCTQGNITKLDFSNDEFDMALCAEVLEHIPPNLLEQACQELTRVTKKWLIIGVPFNQDIRSGSTHCPSCGKTNPPWGHVNSFTENKLQTLFPQMKIEKTNFIGTSNIQTNFISHSLMEFAGHPFGTYHQSEDCVHCGSIIEYTNQRTLTQKLATRVGFICNSIQNRFTSPQPAWIHILFKK